MMKRLIVTFVAALAILVTAFAHAGQINSNIVSTSASINVSESITLTLTGGPLVIPSSGSPSNSINVGYSYNLIPASHASGLEQVGYFNSSTAALTNGTVNVPASSLLENFNGTGFAACNTAGVAGMGVPGASCPSTVVVPQGTLTSQNGIGNGTATYAIQYTGSPLASGTYSGTFSVVFFAP